MPMKATERFSARRTAVVTSWVATVVRDVRSAKTSSTSEPFNSRIGLLARRYTDQRDTHCRAFDNPWFVGPSVVDR